MKRKINLQFILITFMAVITTVMLSVCVFYESFKTEILNDMKIYTRVLKTTGVFALSDNEEAYSNIKSKDVRITLISKDGTVIYDDEVDAETMNDHSGREEVKEALKYGEGQAVRASETLDENNFYYAVRLENGNVLRTAKDAESIWSIFLKLAPSIMLIIAALFMVIIVITHYLTKSIVEPIEKMANSMEDMGDIHTYKELQPFIDTIKKQHEDIMKNARMRQEFTANISHELKTPLTSISGYSELIENGMATDKDITRFATAIHKNSNRLLTLINDIIRLSELDVTESEPVMEDVNIYQIARTAVDMLQVQADKHGVEVRLEGTSGVAPANKTMIEELIYNLTSNAIKYNKQGGKVWVIVEADRLTVTLTVKDTGIGIPEEHQGRVFERFYRVDKSRSKLTGGTGLGLAIVKHVVAQHDARIELESEEGKGTEISVIFNK